MVVAAAVALGGCAGDGPGRPYASVTELFEVLGGEDWCGTELRLTFEDAIGSCGPEEGRILLSTAYPDRATLLQGVHGALDDELVLLVPQDTAADGPWFDLRATDRALLAAPRAIIGGVVLEGEDEIESWIDRNDD